MTIRHGGPPALQTRMRLAERRVNPVLFHAPQDRWYHAPPSEGGWGTIPAQDMAKPLPYICLIPLWLSPFQSARHVARKEKSCAERRPPPKPGGHAVPESGTLGHTSFRPHDGSLSSSFIPAGRLGTDPLSPRASSCRIGPRRQGFASPLRALDGSGPIRKTRCSRGKRGVCAVGCGSRIANPSA